MSRQHRHTLCIALLTAAGIACASAWGDTALSLPTVASALGTTVALDVAIADATAIEAGDIIITYSATALQIDSVALGDDVPSGWMLIPNTGTPGRITASFIGTTPFSGGGTLLAISATVRADATLGETTALAFSSASLSDENGAVASTTTDGSFQCIDPYPPAAVTDLFAVDTPNDDGGSISLTWTLSADDGAGANDVTGYDLLRSETSGTEGFTVLAADLAPGTDGHTDDTAVDGTNYWYLVRTKDITNQTDSAVSGPVTATIIQARITSPTTGSWVHETIDIVGTAGCEAGFQSYYLQWAAGESPGDSDWTFINYFTTPVADDTLLSGGLDTAAILTPDGDYSLRITASDSQNSTSSHTILLHVDNTTPDAPELATAAPFGQDMYVKNGDTISVTGSAEAWANVHTAELLAADGSPLQTVTNDLATTQAGAISGSFTVADFGDTPSVRLRATVNDRSVNVSPPTVSDVLTVDNTLPTVAITEPLDGATPDAEPVRIIGVCADDISSVVRVEVSADGGVTWDDAQLRENAYWHYDFTPPAPLADYTVTARATDLAGNSRISGPITIHYTPELRIVNPGHNGHVPTSPIEISGVWTATQRRDVTIELSTDGGINWSTVTQSSPGVWSYMFTPPNSMATYTLKARATDQAGHVVESLPSALQHYAFSGRPLATIETPGKSADIADFPPTITVVGSVAPFTDGNTVTWTLDYQKTDEGDTWHELATGDQPITRSTLAEWPHNHALAPGDYTLRLTATEGAQTHTVEMPLTNTNAAPEQPHYPDPVNGARDVPTSGTTLRWQGKRAATHKVLLMKWPVPE